MALSTAAARVSETTPAALSAAPPRSVAQRVAGDLLSRASEVFFRTVSRIGKMHPLAAPHRHGVEVDVDVRYHHGDASWHKLDVYRPVHRPGPWPVVFYVHGG